MIDYTQDNTFGALNAATQAIIGALAREGISDATSLERRAAGVHNLQGHARALIPLALWVAVRRPDLLPVIRQNTRLDVEMDNHSQETRAAFWDQVKESGSRCFRNADRTEFQSARRTMLQKLRPRSLSDSYGGSHTTGGAGDTVLKRTLKPHVLPLVHGHRATGSSWSGSAFCCRLTRSMDHAAVRGARVIRWRGRPKSEWLVPTGSSKVTVLQNVWEGGRGTALRPTADHGGTAVGTGSERVQPAVGQERARATTMALTSNAPSRSPAGLRPPDGSSPTAGGWSVAPTVVNAEHQRRWTNQGARPPAATAPGSVAVATIGRG